MKFFLLLSVLLMPFVSQADSYWTKGDYACWGLGPAGILMLSYDDATSKLTVTNGLISNEMQGEAIFFNAGRLGDVPTTRIWSDKTVPMEINFVPPVFSNFADGKPTTLYGTVFIPMGVALPNPLAMMPFAGPVSLPLVPVRFGGIPLFNVKCIASFVNSDIAKRPKASCAKPLTGIK